uniref:RNA-directed RNA polymerase n=1 Tax=Phlebiopsis gigantea mycovirus dsRNA 2 TaxID=349682 RepID=A8KAR4_9VIRU|nr:putative RNA-dependent RNA polymerase [Phlebiopsis gigantea mycovirus dsRNA 2]
MMSFIRDFTVKQSDSGAPDTSPPIMKFKEAVDFYDLDSPPSDLPGAALRFVLFEPLPSEVWNFLDPLLFWNEEFKDYPEVLSELSGPQMPEHTPSPKNVNLGQELDRLYPQNSGRPGGKIHLMCSDVLQTAKNYWSQQLGIRLYYGVNDWGNVAAASLVMLPLLSSAAQEFIAPRLTVARSMFNLPFSDFTKVCKALHTSIRVTKTVPVAGGYSRISTEQARQLYGLDLLPGPSELHKFDPQAEILQRATPGANPLWPSIEKGAIHYSSLRYDQAFKNALTLTMRELIPHTIRTPPTFSEWYNDRMAWAASGGAPGARVVWDEGTRGERINKRGALLAIPEEDLRKVLIMSAGAVLYSKAASKFEKGKRRAIWNTAIEHYLFQAYILDIIDASAISEGASGLPVSWNAATHSSNQRLAAQIFRLDTLGRSVGLMWDFSDFNINHQKSASTAIFTMAVEGIENAIDSNEDATITQVRRDLRACREWVNTAKLNQIFDSGETEPLVMPVLRCLASGERATSFTNTILSRVYRHMVNAWATEQLGYPLIKDGDSQQGDDVFAAVDSVSRGVITAATYNLLGYAGQSYKVTLDYAPRGEFLRLSYDGVAGIVAGYPIRAGLGLISGEFFEESTFDPDARAAAYWEAVTKATRRGANIPQGLIDRLISRNCHITLTLPSGEKTRIVADVDVAITPSALGGVGVTGGAPLPLRRKHKDPEAITTYSSPLGSRPLFSYPKVRASELLRRTKLADLSTLRRLGFEGRELALASQSIVNSALTNAFRAEDRANAITDFASRLHKWKKTVQSVPIVLPPAAPHLHVTSAIQTLWLEALGLDSTRADHGSNPIGYAIIIPSGEGKTTLKREFPELFIDHDDYISWQAVEHLADNGFNHALADYNRQRLLPKDKVLLTWGQDTVPPGYRVLMIPLIRDWEGPRMNEENRAYLEKQREVSWFNSFEERNEAILAVVNQNLNSVRALSYNRRSHLIPNFSPVTPLRHHFGMVSSLTRPLGFSLLEIMLNTVSDLPNTSKYPGQLGKWNTLFNSAIPRSAHGALNLQENISKFNTFARVGGDYQMDLRMDYLLGKLQFLPPTSMSHSADVIVTARDITLLILERNLPNWFSLPLLEFLHSVSQLETSVLRMYTYYIQPTYLAGVLYID